MTKRILSFFLTLTLLLCALPMTQVQAANRRKYITDRAAVDGSDYTPSPALAEKLNAIFDGDAGIYADKSCQTPVNTYLGTSPVRNNGISMYVGPQGGRAMERGTSCFIYANGVYYTLFGESTGSGEPGENSESLNLRSTGSRRATYENFKAWGVRQGTGALVRASGHSFIVLDYDEHTLTYLDGNGDGQGLVAINKEPWEKVFYSYVYYIIQPKELHYAALYATGKCGDDLRWSVDEEGTLTITGTGNILYPAWSNYNDKIRKVVIQGNGINLGNGIFYNCNLLEEIVFEGSAPDLSESAFFGVDATIHYPASFYGWTADLLDHYDGSVEWKPYGMTQLKITQQPTLRQARSADNLTISVSAEGDGLSYCWYAKDAEHDIFVKTSVTGSVYTVNAGTQDRQVMCIVSDQHGNWIQSDIVLIPAIEI